MFVQQKQGGGFDVEWYDSPYEACFHLINNGSIGDGVHGSDAHKQALEFLKSKVERTLKFILENQERDET